MATGITLNTTGCDAPTLVEVAQRAEHAGFDSVWCYDHLSGAVLGAEGCLDVWTVLGAIAATTERVIIGPLVVNVTTHHPVHIAVAAATLQSLSGGRLQLGLGAGASAPSPFAEELTMFHLAQRPAAERRDRVAETIQFLRALWSGVPRFDGTWASYSDVKGVSLPAPPCPIIVGANGPRLAELAGHQADGMNLHSWEEDIPGLVAIARHAAERSGRPDFTVSVEGPLEPDWIDERSPTRRALSDIGVDDVMVRWRAGLELPRIVRA